MYVSPSSLSLLLLLLIIAIYYCHHNYQCMYKRMLYVCVLHYIKLDEINF